ncbi:MAG TPA: sulfate adenylyltransferase [Acidimicrobiia bacterium]|nr:sulfate adenylyltransferase [Acidimicrobiia bacterium]
MTLQPAPIRALPVPLLASPARRRALRSLAGGMVDWIPTDRPRCDLDLLITGAMAPLTGFLGRADYESVCERMRLADGALWPMPITLDVPAEVARRLGPGDGLALREPGGALLGVLWVDEVWAPDLGAEAEAVFRTTSDAHPGVAHLRERTHPFYVGGRIEAVRRPFFPSFGRISPGPLEVRTEFARRGWDRIVAFHTRNPMHRAHFELTRQAAEAVNAALLLHPVVGMTKPGDVDPVTRIRCYQALMHRYPTGRTLMAAIPMAMRMSGPRDSLWNAILRATFGCTHYIVGRDHASPGPDHDGRPFYDPYEAQDILFRHEAETGIATVAFPALTYAPALERYVPADEVPAGAETRTVSGTELRSLLASGGDIPEWITFPEVAAVLRSAQRQAAASNG